MDDCDERMMIKSANMLYQYHVLTNDHLVYGYNGKEESSLTCK